MKKTLKIGLNSLLFGILGLILISPNAAHALVLSNATSDSIYLSIGSGVFKIDANDSGQVTRVLDSGSLNPKIKDVKVNRNGSKIAYLQSHPSSSVYSLWVASADGSNPRNVSKYLGNIHSFDWGNGSKSREIYLSNGDIWGLDSYGNNRKQYTSGATAFDTTPKTSPYSTLFAFNRSNNNGNKEVMTYDVLSSTLRNVSNHSGSDMLAPKGRSWIGDYALAFKSKRNGTYDIYRVKYNGSILTRLTSSSKHNEIDPVVSTKGLIAYTNETISDSKNTIKIINSSGDYKGAASSLQSLNRRQYAWDPEGARLVHGFNNSVRIANYTAGSITVTNLRSTFGTATSFYWSPLNTSYNEPF